MYTVVGMKDVTDFVAPDNEDNGSAQSGGISHSASLNDPATTWDFVVDDINQTINIQNFQPVVIFDENAGPTYTISGRAIPTVPAWNFCRDTPFVNSGWSAAGTLSAIVSFPGQHMQMLFNNNVLGSGFAQQSTLINYVQPGVQYMFSAYLDCNPALVNAQALLQVNWLDVNGATISTITQAFATVHPSVQQNISGVAPAGSVYAQMQLGGQTTVGGTNSGTLTWNTPQFEPMWFANKGVSYPTPDCNFFQVNSVILPDGTTSRKCRLFAGYVEDHQNFYVSKQRHTAVQCASTSKLLETIGLISASYTSTQDTSILTNAISLLPANSSIISQIATNQQNAFAPSSTLIAGVVVDSISFNLATLKEVLNGLVGQSGSLYFVDAYYYLWYVPPSFVGTVVALSDTPDNINSFPYHDFSIEYDSTNPVNVAMVVGSKQKAAVVTDNLTGDGSTTTFSLSFPPENTHVVTVGGTNQRTGVDGVDNAKFGSSLTFKALINKQKATIKFATAPANASAIVVSYTYEDQVISQVISADAVAQQRAQFWAHISDSNITSTTAAKNRGIKELTDYAFPRIILTLSSLNIYMPVGSLILFTCQSENMTNQPFVVQTVDADPQGGGVYRWNYTAGVYNPTLMDHIKNIHKAIKKTPTSANVVVIASTDVAIFDSFVINDSIVINNLFTPSSGPYAYGGYNEYVKQDLTAGSAYYRMDASSGTSETDASGHGFTGTYNGGFTLNQAGALVGDPDKAVLFNGSTGYMSFSDGITVTTSDLTVELWAKIMSFATSGGLQQRLLIHNIDNTSGYQIALQASNNAIAFGVNDATGQVIVGKAGFSTGVWYHIVGQWVASTRTPTLYVNGVAQVNDAVVTGYGLGTIGANIGRRQDGVGFFSGYIDEAAVYKGLALSSGRITTHYNEGANPANRYGFSSYA